MMPGQAWRFVHASVRGSSHSESDTPCQDASACECVQLESGESVLIAVVCDGAGSASQAQVGAQLACQVALAELTMWVSMRGDWTHAAPSDARSWVDAVRTAILARAEADGMSARDYACTLLACAIGESHAIGIQVGDGAIVLRRGESYVPMFWPQRGEYANSTYFVSDAGSASHLEFAVVRDSIDEVALLSDGVQGLALRMQDRAVHAPFFVPMFARLRMEPAGRSLQLNAALARFLDSSDVNARTDDDKTLVLATRRVPRVVSQDE